MGDDTDLLVLLIYHTKLIHNEIFFIPEPKKNSKCRIWNVKQVKTELGSFVCKHILFLHAMLGCDTTSRLFGIGKGTILKKFKANVELQKAAEVFDSTLSTSSQIESAGERVLVVMYGGKNNESLNSLRHRKYCEKLASSLASVDPKGLPPTSAAGKYHSYRVFFQICQWKNSECDMLPESWGWTLSDSGLYPTKTDLPPAPNDLLKVIRCNCSADCSSARCSCQKHGLKCSLACGQCRGTACTNASAFVTDDEENNDEES